MWFPCLQASSGEEQGEAESTETAAAFKWEGKAKNYVVSGLFSDDFKFNKFGLPEPAALNSDYSKTFRRFLRTVTGL